MHHRARQGYGAGKEGAASTGTICPNTPPPVGSVANTDDCGDLDPYNRRGRTEACDARDNTCNTQVDDGAIRRLSASGWVAQPLYSTAQPLQDIAASSISDIWAVGDNGTVVHFPE